jgi:signal transduction histidine kinase
MKTVEAMHGSKFNRIGLHILFLLLYFTYDTLNTAWGENDSLNFTQVHKVLTNIPLMIAAIYFNLYVLMPKFLYQKKYVAYMLSMVALLLVWGLLTRFIGYQFWLAWDKENMPEKYLTEPKHYFVPIRITRNAFRIYPVLALTMLIKVLRDSYKKEKQLRLAEWERHRAEITNLRAQIHPHFFFNTLSSLYSLTLQKSDKAPDVVMRLSGLMHYVLYETSSDHVLLEDEIAHLRDFARIEELRFGDRLDFSFQYSGDIQGKKISPLLLLPFVENAFKHSLSNEVNAAWITIDMKVSGKQLFFTVENSMTDSKTSKPHKGIGLENVRKRLSFSYPGRHELNIQEDGKVFSVHLRIDMV